jgi:hypothetical protein
VREVKPGKLELQRGKSLTALLKELPRECDYGNKCNAQGYKNGWNGYKLHMDTADCGVPVSALLSSASMHDSLAAIKSGALARRMAAKPLNLYIGHLTYNQAQKLGRIRLFNLCFIPALLISGREFCRLRSNFFGSSHGVILLVTRRGFCLDSRLLLAR